MIPWVEESSVANTSGIIGNDDKCQMLESIEFTKY